MRQSEPTRLADETRLARTLFPDIDRALAETAQNEVARELDARAEALITGEGSLATLSAHDQSAELASQLTRAFDRARDMWPGLDIPTVQEFVDRGMNLHTWNDALARDDTLMAVLAPHGMGVAAWHEQLATRAGAPALVLSREVTAEFALLEWPTDRSHMPSVPVTGVAAPATPAYWTLALIPAADEPPIMGHNHSRETHPLIGELLTVQLHRVHEGLGPIDSRTFTWIDGRLGEGRLAPRHVYDPAEHVVRVSTREWAQQGPHQGARPPIR